MRTIIKYITLSWICLLYSHHLSAHSLNQSVELQAHSGGTLYVDAVFADSVPVKLLVDTGASMLTLNQKTFQQLNKHTDLHFSRHLGFRTASGKIHKVKVYRLDNLTLGNSCQLRDVEVAVLANGNNILGMNALTRFAPFGFSMQPPRLDLSNCDGGLVAQQTH